MRIILPVMPVSTARNLYKCHGCDKKGDVIQFVQDFENLTKHEALKKCTAMIEKIQPIQKSTPTETKEITTSSKERTAFIEKIFSSFKNAATRSPQLMRAEISPTLKSFSSR